MVVGEYGNTDKWYALIFSMLGWGGSSAVVLFRGDDVVVER